MKKIYLTLNLLLFSLASSSTSNPILDFVIFNSEKIEITIASGLEDNSKISVQLINDVLSFKTKNRIKNIRVYNNQNIMLYHVPIRSKKLEIRNKLFNSGIYKVQFYFYGDEKPLTTQITFRE